MMLSFNVTLVVTYRPKPWEGGRGLAYRLWTHAARFRESFGPFLRVPPSNRAKRRRFVVDAHDDERTDDRSRVRTWKGGQDEHKVVYIRVRTAPRHISGLLLVCADVSAARLPRRRRLLLGCFARERKRAAEASKQATSAHTSIARGDGSIDRFGRSIRQVDGLD